MSSIRITKIVTFLLCIGIVLSANAICFADMGKKFDQLKPQHSKATLSISGEISTIQPTYIGIITLKNDAKKEDTEMLFLIDEQVTFKSKELAELLEGDQVKITYDNITEPDPADPEKMLFVQRETKEIQYLHSQSGSLKSGK